MAESRDERPAPALSFGAVADAYDRARPTYPREAASWLVGSPEAKVVADRRQARLAPAGERMILL